MKLNLLKYLAVGVMILSPFGCEPQPVVEPADDDTTVIEERETVNEQEPMGTDAQPDTGVDVNVGEPGVDVNVDTDGTDTTEGTTP
jgi:hypothetical protein